MDRTLGVLKLTVLLVLLCNAAMAGNVTLSAGAGENGFPCVLGPANGQPCNNSIVGPASPLFTQIGASNNWEGTWSGTVQNILDALGGDNLFRAGIAYNTTGAAPLIQLVEFELRYAGGAIIDSYVGPPVNIPSDSNSANGADAWLSTFDISALIGPTNVEIYMQSLLPAGSVAGGDKVFLQRAGFKDVGGGGGGAEIPEPSTYLLMGCGLLALGFMRTKRKA